MSPLNSIKNLIKKIMIKPTKLEQQSNNDLFQLLTRASGEFPEVRELMRRYSMAIAIMESPHLYECKQVWNEEENRYDIKPLDKSK
jgi:hypothetical protein